MVKTFSTVFLLFLSFLMIKLAYASNFTTDYNITYTVLPNALTHVEMDIVLTNQTSQYYPSSYSIKVGFKDIENIKAADPKGTIQPVVTKSSEGANIALVFNKRNVGIGNKLVFSISFDTVDIAQRLGKIWQIDIPGLSHQDDFQSFNVRVLTPSFLGNPTYIKPKVDIINPNALFFTKDQLGKSGISIAYGKEQIYKFVLKYHLNNPNFFPVKKEIALPPKTNYQDIVINNITPKPKKTKSDRDGNHLAEYTLSPFQKINIEVRGKARISLAPKKEVVSYEKLRLYLKKQPYWQISNDVIKKLAYDLKTPEAIYKYVVKNLNYDFSRVTNNKPRLGAVALLKNKSSAVCLEFTDLFITLTRALGIPAREIDGFAYTKNPKERPLSLVKDVLHAWPEYYDKKLQTWIMVDPTWENTTGGIDYFKTLDFNHFAFVIKGASSNYPIAPGAYKIFGESNSQDVQVSIDKSFE